MQNNNKNLDKLYQALAQLMFELNIDFNLFEKNLKKHYAICSYNSCETIARTALNTGIDRRLVSLILKQHKQYIKPSSLQLIIKQLKKSTARTDGLINKHGKKSLETIMNRIAYGSTTLHSIIAELLQLGYIQDLNNQIKFIKKAAQPAENQAIQLLSINIQNCINDFIVEKCYTDNGIGYNDGLDNPNPLTSDPFKLYNGQSN